MNRSVISELARALEKEKKRNALLEAQLNTRNRQPNCFEWIEEPNVGDNFSEGFMGRNSTMRESRQETTRNANDVSILNSISFASLNITECRPIEGEDEIDRKSFERWRELLDASMEFAGVVDEFSKMSIFKIKAGSKLMEVLDNTSSQIDDPDVTVYPYSNVMSRLKKHFNSRDYVLLQRQKLRSMAQNKEESDLNYVKRVAAVAKLCDYATDQLMENVAAVVQAQALNIKVREAGRKVMRKGGTLSDFFDKIRGIEIEKLHEENFIRNHREIKRDNQEIAAVRYDHPSVPQLRQHPQFVSKPLRSSHTAAYNQFRMTGSYRGRGGAQRGMNRISSSGRKPCWRCTGSFHGPQECHAINKVCRNCQRLGHIERACRQLPQVSTRKRIMFDEKELPSPSKLRKVAMITTDQEVTDEEKDTVSVQ